MSTGEIGSIQPLEQACDHDSQRVATRHDFNLRLESITLLLTQRSNALSLSPS